MFLLSFLLSLTACRAGLKPGLTHDCLHVLQPVQQLQATVACVHASCEGQRNKFKAAMLILWMDLAMRCAVVLTCKLACFNVLVLAGTSDGLRWMSNKLSPE